MKYSDKWQFGIEKIKILKQYKSIGEDISFYEYGVNIYCLKQRDFYNYLPFLKPKYRFDILRGFHEKELKELKKGLYKGFWFQIWFPWVKIRKSIIKNKE